MDFTKKWVTHLRNNHKSNASHTVLCPKCNNEIQNDIEAWVTHVEANPEDHQGWDGDETIRKQYNDIRLHQRRAPHENPPTQDRPKKRPSGTDDPSTQDPENPHDRSDSEGDQPRKRRSPPPAEQPQASPTSPNMRSRARNPLGRVLWDGDQPTTQDTKGRSVQPQMTKSDQRPPVDAQPSGAGTTRQPNDDGVHSGLAMMLQPETRPISQDQLVAEVKGIYAGLVMVETKCIEVDNAQSSNPDANKLNNEQWQALIALHRTLLHEHHDFFLASQHPSASAPLRRLASKYAMPARMWRHGIHSFLELLRHRLPASLEHMLTFLYLAYSMMALLYETVPAFEDTWIECLGDLGRYRMAIEDDDIRDREVWTGVSRHWYSKASDKSPTTGRLYHHLAILARPNALQQLYYYTKSLCVPIPFVSAKESIMTLFDPLLTSNSSRLSPVDAAYVRVNGILFSGKAKDMLEESKSEFFELLDAQIGRTTKRWLESGYYIGISLSCALLGFGDESSVLMKAVSKQPDESDVAMEDNNVEEVVSDDTFTQALLFAIKCYQIVMQRWGDTNTLSFVHTTLVFINYLTQHPAAMAQVQDQYPWKLTSLLLNHILNSFKDTKPRMDGEFPGPEKDELPRPLPEDYALRGLTYAEEYHPKGWFVNDKIDEDEKYFELASMIDERKERILYLGNKIAAHEKWLIFDGEFKVSQKYDV